MDISDGMEKSWDHAWTTEEMRKKRREWSLAGDVGLLKHLQQFSENIVSRANRTQEALDSLATQLNETAIVIDNVTNTSLALANTQFIESRVQEDDIEVTQQTQDSTQNSMDQDLAAANVIASVSEGVKQGLNIMDQKYRRMEVVDSDSEEEGDEIVLSVLGPNDPYQDRPLPYVIGSDKWKTSSKIGLESSSSESEQVDEEEEESESDKDNKIPQRILDVKNGPKRNVTRLSSSSSDSDNYNQQSNNAYINNEKLDEISQATINSGSEEATPNTTVPRVPVLSNTGPNFAEELAKRLGSVHQAEKPVSVDEPSNASINRFKDDLFAPEENEDVFSKKSDNIFTGTKNLFGDETTANLWKEKPYKPKATVIPPSVDVPPPISTISSKPKSAIDDLFADADSEDSDDIFSSKTTVKRIAKDNSDIKQTASAETVQKKHLDVIAPGTSNKFTTSTPETAENSKNLFGNEEFNDGDLFGTSKSSKSADVSSTTEPNLNKKIPIGGVSILGNMLASDIESKLLRRKSSGSTASDNLSGSMEAVRGQDSYPNDSAETSGLNLPAENPYDQGVTVEESASSGISIEPPSINNTAGSTQGLDFQPRFTSTRLNSDDLFRERIRSDSLFAARSQNPAGNLNVPHNTEAREESVEQISSIGAADDVFENDDLFGPPPLPKADSKPAKSKVMSLFDDSDSGDELFSTTSSGSRSQKSSDFLATTPQYSEKTKSIGKKGLFDEDIDIFGSKDAPDVDIFGITSKAVAAKEDASSSAKKLTDASSGSVNSKNWDSSRGANSDKARSTKSVLKTNLFDDDDDVDDDDLFAVTSVKTDRKVSKKEAEEIKRSPDDDDLFSAKISKSRTSDNAVPEKEERSIESRANDVAQNGTNESRNAAKTSDAGLFSTAKTRGLLFEDNDYDDLFNEDKKTSRVHGAIESKTFLRETKVDTIEEMDSREKKSISDFNKSTLTSDSASVFESGSPKTSEAEKEVQGSVDGVKKPPPKTLNIKPVSSAPEEGVRVPRREVSGKIKDLMGKMGDFKILSPTDAPPLWRRSEEKTDEEDDGVDRDSDDGGCVSTQSRGSPPSVSGPSLSEGSVPRRHSPPSTISGESNVETAISFDEPAQVETLSTASKTRVRIQAKRRPQSRHARKSALRQSGIDFDTVDGNKTDSQATDISDNSNRESSNSGISNSGLNTGISAGNVTVSNLPVNDNAHRTTDSNISLAIDDKSELTFSKESSISANKTTLLSPSTDEEDLFDVPPDLPEDPQKEDTLFGRAPILSPVENVFSGRMPPPAKPLRDTVIGETVDDGEEAKLDSAKYDAVIVDKSSDDVLAQSAVETKSKMEGSTTYTVETRKKTEKRYSNDRDEDSSDDDTPEPIDPLRDSSHDPLKDPSQLFAFVTKTPSPEKGKNLLFSEDNSLFSSGPKRPLAEPRRQILDLFAEDAGSDLFSAPLASVKKPLKDTKISLFDDEDAQNDEDDSLFGVAAKKKLPARNDNQPLNPAKISQRKTAANLFEDGDEDEDDNLFAESEPRKVDVKKVPEQKLPGNGQTSKLNDIFGDQSSGEEDIFATKKIIPKKIASAKLFASDDEDDDGQIFGRKPSKEPQARPVESRQATKKAVRDLRKTAEKIVEDPLSILQDE